MDEAQFGDFEHGVGFMARVELLGQVSTSVVTSLWVDYRHVEFDFKPSVLSGDDHAGGATEHGGGRRQQERSPREQTGRDGRPV